MMRFMWCVALIILCACNQQKNDAVTILWEENKPTGIVIPQSLLTGFVKDSIDRWLEVNLANNNTAIIGEYEVNEKDVVFKPLIGFTRGLQYQINWKGELLQQIEIPADTSQKKPAVLAIYPSAESLPVNLLKMYIVFSKPMREGQALGNISVVRNGRDTLPSVFLNLEPELWNNERTILTVWLDPGRIKRGLQPNERLGPPLETGNRYEVLINQHWEDGEGTPLVFGFKKQFVAVSRDDKSPDPAAWVVNSPKASTQDPLQIQLYEPLDYLVLKNAIQITDEKNNEVSGVIEIRNEETMLQFIPAQPWAPGSYNILIEARLEDLAGNNLQRLFDRDILKDTVREVKEFKRIFTVH